MLLNVLSLQSITHYPRSNVNISTLTKDNNAVRGPQHWGTQHRMDLQQLLEGLCRSASQSPESDESEKGQSWQKC